MLLLEALQRDEAAIAQWDGGKSIGVETSRPSPPPSPQARRFPGYVPELDPDEFVWAQAKRELSDIDHDRLVPLTLHVMRSLQLSVIG